MSTQETYADRIGKLLRKAEDPATTPEEAEAFFAKAQQLMIKYAIDQEMIDRAAGRETTDTIVEKRIEHAGIYQSVLFDLTALVAKNNDCKILYSKVDYVRPHRTIAHVVGYSRDVERVELLVTSLQLQAIREQTRWYKTYDTTGMGGMAKFKARRQFLIGFNSAIGARLRAAREEAKAEANVEHGEDSVALVLRSKALAVEDEFTKMFPHTRKISRSMSTGDFGAHAAGSEAGRRADVGNARLRGQKGLER